MKNNDNLINALIACISQCEKIGTWSDNGDDMVSPIDGYMFKDCADVCNLSLRLCFRNSCYREELKLSYKLIEASTDNCTYIIEANVNKEIEIELSEAITKYDQALTEIKIYLSEISQQTFRLRNKV